MLGIFKSSDLRRYPRLSCHWGVTVRMGATVYPAHMLNVSRGGCLVRPVSASLFLQNQNAVITMGGTELGATVVGRPGRTWRLRFVAALDRDRFDDLIRSMTRRQAAEDAAEGAAADPVVAPALAWLSR